MLKLKFDSKQQYQLNAIEAVVDIFAGQAIKQSTFTAGKRVDGMFGTITELGYGNKLDLTEEQILRNVIAIQDKHRLKRSRTLRDQLYDVPNFAIEMETGTGKTYVYTRTILEMRARYGFAKFIIVVPSVAIREGVKKSLELTEQHFRELYPNEPFNYFVYNSDRLTEVRDFATSESTEIMIINIDAFRKSFTEGGSESALRIFKVQDKMEGRKPIEFIQQTNPIVIIDEPQSVDNTDKAKEAIKSLNPLCILRYSATHRDTYNLMYRLGPVEAYEQGLVKGIEVFAMRGGESERHIRVLSTTRTPNFSATLELKAINAKGEYERKSIKVNAGKRRDIESLTNNPSYAGLFVANIGTDPERQFVEFDNGEVVLLAAPNENANAVRAQIRATIERHLDREMRFLERGIKILSLFFLDTVSNYRVYTEKGPENGPYAKIFEEEYLSLIQEPKYTTLFTRDEDKRYALNPNVQEVHNGYFAMDKGKKGTASAGEVIFVESTGEGRAQKDDSAYDLIMKDKERLLSTDTNLRFIFSHSALKEGWDNPNVFQICTLVETNDTMTKRQKIGRGLRLPVDQTGERVHDEQVNVLTVVANESYTEFAETLQSEIESETNTKFGVIDARLFENILFQPTPTTNPEPLGYDRAEEIVQHLERANLLDRHGRATTELKEQVAEEKVPLPEEYVSLTKDVVEEIKAVTKRLPVMNANERVEVRINKQVYEGSDFSALWDRIKHKTKYKITLDTAKLVTECVKLIEQMPPVKLSPIIFELVKLDINQAGIDVSDPIQTRTYVKERVGNKNLPDLLAHIQTYTGLKRRTIAEILTKTRTLESVYNNPEQYLEQVVEIINRVKRHMLVDGIKYEQIAGGYYEQTQFESDELVGYLKQNALPATRSIFTHTIYQSNPEKSFAEKLESDQDVKVYMKLPHWFTVPTPLGDYNPDWAVVLDKNGVEKLYFIIETKGSMSLDDLRFTEDAKIRCGQKHFTSLEQEVSYSKADSYEVWRNQI